MELVLDLHGRLAQAVALYLAALGIWAIALGLRGIGPTPSLRGGIVIGVAAAVVQGALGLALLATRGVANGLHVLYGFALVAALPLAASMVRDRQPRGRSLALGFAALFAMGLALRGCTTA